MDTGMEFVDFMQNSEGLEYLYKDDQEMDWPDFFEIHKERFPMLIYIAGGNYGETSYDDFCSDQIYQVQTYSNQRRIVAIATKVCDRYIDIYLSIPVNTKHKFCVVRGHRSVVGKPQTLEEIVRENPFPISVKFAPGISEVYVGNSREDVSSYATILLTREYTENFLLGNCVVNGQVCKSVTIAALSGLISVAPVSGINGKSAAFFRKLLSELQASLSDVKYDRTAGNPRITKITSEGTGTGNTLPKINPPLLPFGDKAATDTCESSDASDDDTYEKPPEPTIGPALPPRGREVPPNTLKKISDVPLHAKKHYANAAIVHPIPSELQEAPPRPRKEPVLPQSPIVKPENKSTEKSSGLGRGPLPDPTSYAVKEPLFSEADYMYMDEPDMYEVLSCVPQPSTENQTGETKMPTVSSFVSQPSTETQTGETKMPEMSSCVSQPSTENQKGETRIPPVSSPGGNKTVESQQGAASGGKDHLQGLSVEDIGECLRKLRLGHYAEQFSDDMIDGGILSELTKEDLESEFGFKKVEQIRLWKFISEGYVPK